MIDRILDYFAHFLAGKLGETRWIVDFCLSNNSPSKWSFSDRASFDILEDVQP